MSKYVSYQESIELTTTVCVKCGVLFAIPTHMINERRQDHKELYCPSGHCLVFRDESEAEKLQREVNRLKQKTAELAQDAHDANQRAEKAVLEKRRIENRVHAGVCPDCNRTFVNVARHMKSKHKLECAA